MHSKKLFSLGSHWFNEQDEILEKRQEAGISTIGTICMHTCLNHVNIEAHFNTQGLHTEKTATCSILFSVSGQNISGALKVGVIYKSGERIRQNILTDLKD